VPNFVNQELDEVRFSIKGSRITIGTIEGKGLITDSGSATIIAQSVIKPDSTKVNSGIRIDLIIQQVKKNGGN